MYTMRDKQARPGITTAVERDISVETWPFSIDTPHPPFAWGKVVALVQDKELAEKMVQLLNSDAEKD